VLTYIQVGTEEVAQDPRCWSPLAGGVDAVGACGVRPGPGACFSWRAYARPTGIAERGAVVVCAAPDSLNSEALFGLVSLKFNSHHINVLSNTWSTKRRLIACMSVQIRSNLRDESIKPN
jgi:hypothetical protein